MQIKLIFLSVFLFLTLTAQAQFADDFSDGDWSKNPIWTGQTDSFIVNTKKELQLNAKSAGNATITTAYNCEQVMVWEFLVRMEFAPSAANRLFILLTNDGQNPAQGYALLIGEDGSNDKIKLLKYQDKISTGTVLATCANIVVQNNIVNARIKVKRDANNLWTIDADYSGSFALKNELTFQENNAFPLVKNTKFGFYCEYTDSRKDKFFFDDIKVSKNELDATPPTVLSVAQDSKLPNRINVVFSEVVDSVSAKQPLAYTIDKGAGIAQKITYNYDRVSLDYNVLQPATTYNLQISTISDLAKNVMKSQTLSFTTAALPTTTQSYDIIINEIMADPLPQIGLPKAEFVELYNRSTKTIDLQGFSLKDKGSTQYKFPKFSLAPDRYVIIYKREKGIDFGKYGDTIALPMLFALDSDNEEISLFNEKNELVDKVNFGLANYQDAKKADGGWTLERINPNTPCLGAYNFTASQNDDGGTPGKKNAVFSTLNDPTPLRLTYAFPNNADEILIQFNKNIDQNSLQNTAFEIETGVKNVAIGATNNEVKLTLATAMQKGKTYNLKIKSPLKDCIGNAMVETAVTMGIPEPVTAEDVVINEVLFNPKTGGIDFVELYNRSNKVININDLAIDNRQKGDQKEITANYLLLPKNYVVLTENKAILMSQGYDVKNNNAIVQTDLPTFDDTEGNVQLIKADAPGKLIIDEMDYDDTYHYPLLKDKSGVSLERINPDANSKDKNNWYSAASVAGFATPTYQNSQFLILQSTQNERFNLSNTRFSPDGDGEEDYLLLQYKNDMVGMTATVSVYDIDGRFIKSLLKNELLDTEGVVRWDGSTESNTVTPIGIYILLIEYFTPDGKIGKEKKVVSLVTKL